MTIQTKRAKLANARLSKTNRKQRRAAARALALIDSIQRAQSDAPADYECTCGAPIDHTACTAHEVQS